MALSAVSLASQKIDELDFCVIDTETTGGSPEFCRVIDVAVFRFQGGEIVEKFESLINPGKPIPFWISQLTGITDDMVENAPPFEDIAEDLNRILSKGVFVAHNANFDYSFIQEEFKRSGAPFNQPKCCTLRIARRLYPDLPSKSLGNLCSEMLIDIWDRHRAAGDAEATVYVFKEMLKVLRNNHRVETWGDLDGFQKFGPLSLPEGLTIQSVANLPAGPGRYVFKNKAGEVIFKGVTKDIRARIQNLFRSNNVSSRSQKYRSLVCSIEVEREGAVSRLQPRKKASV